MSAACAHDRQIVRGDEATCLVCHARWTRPPAITVTVRIPALLRTAWDAWLADHPGVEVRL